MKLTTLAALVGGALVAIACSGTGNAPPPACNENPFECGAGTTCWAKDSIPTFGCLASGLGQPGDSCQNIVGQATCGDGLMCLQTANAGGKCVHYCDTAHPCTAGATCTAAVLGSVSGPQTHVCAGGATTTPAKDGG